jgi:hypothetical protein
MHGCAPQSPLFSVIVPLEFHREHWKRCLLAWQAQTMAKSQFEVILVMPPDFPAVARDELTALLSAQDRIEYSGEIHDIGLCAVGAAAAQGAFFFLRNRIAGRSRMSSRSACEDLQWNPSWQHSRAGQSLSSTIDCQKSKPICTNLKSNSG